MVIIVMIIGRKKFAKTIIHLVIHGLIIMDIVKVNTRRG